MSDGMIHTDPLKDFPNIIMVTIDNPPINLMNQSLFLRLKTIFEELGQDGTVRCAILTASGSRAFVAGADVKDFANLNPAKSLIRSRLIRNAINTIHECIVPVIGAVNSAALGAGMAIAAACDVLVAAETATFGLPEINVGVLGGAQHLSSMVSPKQMRWMALSGKRLTARELMAAGAIEQVVPADQLLEAAIKMAAEIAEKSPAAIRLQKECLNLIETMGVHDGYHVEQFGTAILSALPEAKEAAAAYLQKRKPHFD